MTMMIIMILVMMMTIMMMVMMMMPMMMKLGNSCKWHHRSHQTQTILMIIDYRDDLDNDCDDNDDD